MMELEPLLFHFHYSPAVLFTQHDALKESALTPETMPIAIVTRPKITIHYPYITHG
jgi:hypothetical protein